MGAEDLEEQGYEIEALQSIFIEEFSWVEEPLSFEISLRPAVDEGAEMHVHASMRVTFVEDYPSQAIPEYEMRSIKGLSTSILGEMKELAVKTSTEELGGPVVYNVCEALKDWLTDHNFPGQDGSMYAEMMRKEAAKEAAEKLKEGIPLKGGEKSDGEVQMAKDKAKLKARAAGDPVTLESFAAWKVAHEAELKEEILRAHAEGKDLSDYDSYVLSLVFESKAKKEKLTGRQLFLEKKAGAVEEDADEGDDTVFKVSAADDDEDDDDSDYVPSDDD